MTLPTSQQRINKGDFTRAIGRCRFTGTAESIESIFIFLLKTEDEVVLGQLVERNASDDSFLTPGIGSLRRRTDHDTIGTICDSKFAIGEILEIQFIVRWIESVDHMDQRHTTVVHAVGCHNVTFIALTTDDSQLLAKKQAGCIRIKVRIADL